MIVCIEVFPGRACFSASDDPSGSPVTRAGRFDSELTIIPALLLWQKSFIIAENGAILVIWKWTALFDQLQRVPGFARQFVEADNRVIGHRARKTRKRKRQRQHDKQGLNRALCKMIMLHEDAGVIKVA